MNSLDAERILESIGDNSSTYLEHLEVFQEIDSTNSYLLGELPPPAGRYRVALADFQTAGRGRRGRTWNSPPGAGICLSVAYTFAESPQNLPGLTLAVGIGVAQTLEQLGIERIGLKWPNDIVAGDGKVGGILTEVAPGGKHEVTVVIGIGLNVDLSFVGDAQNVAGAIGAATDLKSHAKDLPDNSTIAAAIIESLFESLRSYEANGFTHFLEVWPRLDWLCGRNVSVEVSGRELSGLANGIDNDGALMVKTGSGSERVLSGSISLIGRLR